MEKETLILSSDHAGYWLKQEVKDFLCRNNYLTEDVGCFSSDSCDYPDFAHALAQKMDKGTYRLGIVICSTGNGITMTINKHPHIRAALCWNTEIAELAIRHNNANVIGLPAHFITPRQAFDIVTTALQTKFEGGRHLTRIQKIPIGGW